MRSFDYIYPDPTLLSVTTNISGANRGGRGGAPPPRKKSRGATLMVRVLPCPLDKK